MVKFGGSPVVFDRREEFVVLEQSPQTAAVMRYSVVALVDAADNEGDELTLDLAQRSRTRHR
jgi:hypothetical protein